MQNIMWLLGNNSALLIKANWGVYSQLPSTVCQWISQDVWTLRPFQDDWTLYRLKSINRRWFIEISSFIINEFDDMKTIFILTSRDIEDI